jgi:hypothetical protein
MTGRLLSLLAIIVGIVLFAAQLPTRFDISPFPGSALHVKLHFGVRFAGDYIVEVVMPKAGNELDPGTETVPCEFSFIISNNDVVVHSQYVDAMNRESEFGWANTQQYRAGHAFHLRHGDYAATIRGSTCPTAAKRGASVTVSRVDREHILGSLIAFTVAAILLLAGVAGILIAAFRPGPKLATKVAEIAKRPSG